MNAIEILCGMREKIERGWTQGCSAKNRNGYPVVASSPDACEWCLVGSLWSFGRTLSASSFAKKVYEPMKESLARRNESEDWADYNDAPGRTKNEILALIDDAIEIAKHAQMVQ